MRDAFARTLLELALEDPSVVFITGDLGFGVFEEFRERCPQQYINAGVAEQNMTAVATGLALSGRKVLTYSIGNFPVLRCLEQIRNDAAYHEANVNVVSIGAGFSYGPLGMSHHATEDIAIMRALPGVAAYVPGTKADTSASVRDMINRPGVGYLRLDKSVAEETTGAEPFSSGSWRLMSAGDEVAIVATGGILAEAQRAAWRLRDFGVRAAVVNANQFGLQEREVPEYLLDYSIIACVEEHTSAGGLAGLVAEELADSGWAGQLIRIGLPRRYVSDVGSQTFLRDQLGLNAPAIVQRILDHRRRQAPLDLRNAGRVSSSGAD